MLIVAKYQWVRGALSLGYSSRGEKLTAHLCLVQG